MHTCAQSSRPTVSRAACPAPLGGSKAPPVERLPTITDVAREAGVHHSTVSRALRRHPSIPEGTRARVEEAARKLGYRPDPLLSALANRKMLADKPSYRATLAWLTNFDTARGWAAREHIRGYYEGAKARAEQLGFVLDEIWSRESGQSSAGLSRLLRARGIRGILLPPQPVPHTHIQLDWDGFAAVSFGSTLTRPRLHTIGHDHYRSLAKLVRHLAAIGFRSPAFYYEQAIDERVDGTWAAGFRFGMEKAGLPSSRALHPLRQPDPDAIVARLKKEKPDVILVNYSLWLELAPRLEAAGLHVPSKLSVAVVTVPDGKTEPGGITENARLMGAMAVDVISGLVQRGDYGLPQRPFRMVVEGEYTAGKTILPPGGKANQRPVVRGKKRAK